MKAYIVATQGALAPFGEHPGEGLIANRKLRDHQREVLLALGLEPSPLSPGQTIDDKAAHLVVEDRLFFSLELLRTFVSRSKVAASRTVAALKVGNVTDGKLTSTQGARVFKDRVEYDLYFHPEERLRTAPPEPVIIDAEQEGEPVRVPPHMCGGRMRQVPVTDLLLLRVDHWTNLYLANMSFLLARLARLKGNKKALLGLALRARSLNQWRCLSRWNQVGRGVDIHPTAYVEASVVGDGVSIGAGSVVRGSIVGAGSRIANNATVELSTLGEGCSVMNGCTVQFSTLYPDTLTMAKLIGFSLVGRDGFVGDGVTLTDFRFDSKNVVVLKDGKPIETEALFLGACLGHGVYLGAGCVVAPGRAIPGPLRITPETGRIILRPEAFGITGFQLVNPKPLA